MTVTDCLLKDIHNQRIALRYFQRLMLRFSRCVVWHMSLKNFSHATILLCDGISICPQLLLPSRCRLSWNPDRRTLYFPGMPGSPAAQMTTYQTTYLWTSHAPPLPFDIIFVLHPHRSEMIQSLTYINPWVVSWSCSSSGRLLLEFAMRNSSPEALARDEGVWNYWCSGYHASNTSFLNSVPFYNRTCSCGNIPVSTVQHVFVSFWFDVGHEMLHIAGIFLFR